MKNILLVWELFKNECL